MDEMRFNSSQEKQNYNQTEWENLTAKNVKKKSKKLFLSIVFLSIIILLIIAWIKFFGWRWSFSMEINEKNHYAVFLDNGQVYFGHILSSSKNLLVLSEVFYLQTPDGNSPEAGTKFNLVKLGDELHGPKDKMSINTSHIMFYEEMREDSQIVEAIKNYNYQ